MASLTLGKPYDEFLSHMLKEERFQTLTEALRAAVRLVQEHDARMKALNECLLTQASGS